MLDMVESKRRGYLTERIFIESCACPGCGHDEDDAFRVAREIWRRTPIRFYDEVGMGGGETDEQNRQRVGSVRTGSARHPSEPRRKWYVYGPEMDRIPLEWECSSCGLRWYLDDSPNGFRKVLLDLEEDADG